METISFEKGAAGTQLIHGSKSVSLVTYSEKSDGKIYVFAEGDVTNELPVLDALVTMNSLRQFYANKAWIEVNSVSFKRGESGKPVYAMNGISATTITFFKRPSRVLWTYITDNMKVEADSYNSLEMVRQWADSMGWVENTVMNEQKSQVKCECGAAHTSNPNLHSALMPCPLYRKGA